MSQNIPKVVFFEVFKEEKSAICQFLPEGINAIFYENTIQEEKCDISPGTIISIRTQSIIPLDWETNIVAVLSRSTGYDHLEVYRKNSSQGISYGYLPTYCARSVAEHALTVWSCLLKKLPNQTEQFKTFNRSNITGAEIEHKNILVVGVGNIGIEIVKIATALNMNVDGVDIDERFDHVNYILPENDLSKYDIIVSAMNLTDSNRNYFNSAFFDRVKKGSIFINISRGELSPTPILFEYLNNGTLAGIGLDVFDIEKKLAASLRTGKSDNEIELVMQMNEHPNVILTPHNAFNTHEATQRKSEQTVEQIKAYIDKGKFLWEVP